MTLSPALRKLALTVHLTTSIGWIGAVVAYLALGVAAVTSSSPDTIRAAWTAMELTGWWVIVPLAIAALLTGVVISLGTRWGLFRHYWVLISLGLTVLCTVVLLLHMPTVSAMASVVRAADGTDVSALGGDLFHPGAGLLLLLLVTGLNVYKPAGLTAYGWRKQQEKRHARRMVASRRGSASEAAHPVLRDTPDVDAQRSKRSEAIAQSMTVHDRRPPEAVDGSPERSSWRALATRAGYFTAHFAEMWFAMVLGMAFFMIAVAVQGSALPFEPTSLQFQLAMSLFMIVPMAAWMRIRGCDWRESAEMSAAMLLSTAVVLPLRLLELSDAQRWVASNQHALMLAAMLAVMLHRRERYTSGYWFGLLARPSRV